MKLVVRDTCIIIFALLIVSFWLIIAKIEFMGFFAGRDEIAEYFGGNRYTAPAFPHPGERIKIQLHNGSTGIQWRQLVSIS